MKLGLKIPVPGVDYSNVDVEVAINGIDPEGDVDAQITASLETASQAFVRLDENVEVALSEILAPETGVPGYRERLEGVEQVIGKLTKRFNKLVPKVRDHIQSEGHTPVEPEKEEAK